MEITVKKADLVKELSLGQGVVEKKTTIPVLSNVLVEAREGEVILTVTDLELGIRSSCPAVVKKSGATTVPARKLLDYVRLLPDAELAIKVSENHSANIVCGRARTRIAGMARDNFPELPKMPAALTSIPAGLLANVISKTIFSIANEESRYTLTGGLMVLKEGALVMVATDGHRLAHIEMTHSFEGISGELKALVPKKAMVEILKMATEAGSSASVGFATDENHLFFECGKRLLIARRLTGQFPDFERVLPKEKGHSVVLNREEVTAAVRRVSQFADDRSHAVRLELTSDELKLVSSGSDVGESEESLPIEYGGEKMKIGFNSQYLLEFLGVAETETVEIDFRGEDSAGQLRLPAAEGVNYRYVVMPMRI
jgi:DNA polymerase-3 subunit beta